MDNLGEGGNHALRELGALAQQFITGVQRAVDKRQIEIDQTIEHVEAFVFGAHVEWRRNDDTLNYACGHRLITLALAAANGPNRD